jgi:hypothetical protein
VNCAKDADIRADTVEDMPAERADSPATIIKNKKSENRTVGSGREGAEKICCHYYGGDDHVDCKCKCFTEGEHTASEVGKETEEDSEYSLFLSRLMRCSNNHR